MKMRTFVMLVMLGMIAPKLYASDSDFNAKHYHYIVKETLLRYFSLLSHTPTRSMCSDIFLAGSACKEKSTLSKDALELLEDMANIGDYSLH